MSLKKNVYAHVTITLMKVWNILTPPSSFLPLCSWFPVPCPEAATQVPSVKDSCLPLRESPTNGIPRVRRSVAASFLSTFLRCSHCVACPSRPHVE